VVEVIVFFQVIVVVGVRRIKVVVEIIIVED
jgi:hypothetical protein